jgi:aldose 1-epimerase
MPSLGPTLLEPERFKTVIEGRTVGLYLLRNAAGMTVAITNYGAKIAQILVPDRHGVFDDVVLGYDSIEGYVNGSPSMGAFVGRYAGRIGNAAFTLDGKQHILTANNGPHCLHGGIKGSRFRVFDVGHVTSKSLSLRYVFADGEEGFPGELDLRVTYTVTDANELAIDYEARAIDQPTIANFTSHAFFNLEGECSIDLRGHEVMIAADQVLAMTPDLVPTGDIIELQGGALDLRQPRPLGERIGGPVVESTSEAAARTARIDGYDDCYVVRQTSAGGLNLCARVHAPLSGRVMETWSTEPALQFYTGKLAGEKLVGGPGKSGRAYVQQTSFCMEPQGLPNAPHCPWSDAAVVRTGGGRSGRIVYRFSAA